MQIWQFTSGIPFWTFKQTSQLLSYNTSQENTSKCIENATSLALTKAQSITSSATLIDTRNFGTNCTLQETSWTSTWLTYNHNMSQQPEINMYQVYRPYENHLHPQTHTNQHYRNQTPLDLNQSVVKLFRCQTELTHSTQCLHQQITETLNNITRSSLHQENLYFINDIPIFKAKGSQSFDEWLEQIDKVAALTNRSIQACPCEIPRLI